MFFMECITSHVTIVRPKRLFSIGMVYSSVQFRFATFMERFFSETIRIFEDLFSDELTDDLQEDEFIIWHSVAAFFNILR